MGAGNIPFDRCAIVFGCKIGIWRKLQKAGGSQAEKTDTSTYEYIKIHKDIARSFLTAL